MSIELADHHDWIAPSLSLKGKRVWVAGNNGLVGSAMVERLQSEGCEIITVSRADLDLRRQDDVEDWLTDHQPEVIILAAARVGGILANDRSPADFLYDNLMIETNIIHSAYMTGVQRLLFLGSSCIYPREAPQPMKEQDLLTGAFESTNEAYAIAKITGMKLCEFYRRQYGCDFITAIPCNLYGPNDLYDLERSHVIPALIMKAHLAKERNEESLEIWGSGTPHREFMHVHDLADALVFLLKNYNSGKPINVGYGADYSIKDLAGMVKGAIGFDGDIIFNADKPDGTPRKLMDSSRINEAGWNASIDLEEGLRGTYAWYQNHIGLRFAS